VRHRTAGTRFVAALVVSTALAGSGCGPSPITSDRIERAIAPTFANLVHLQLSRAGLSSVPASDIRVTASCTRLAAGDSRAGAGDWACALVWAGPNGRSLRDRYDVSVTPDGCYTATVDAAEAQLGGPTFTTPDGRNLRNLLYAFEGCFDTT
jgi:hypothetical protein